MIILLGFPKSGTTSFTWLFNKLHMKSFHWTFRNDTDYIGNWIKKMKNRNEKLLSFIPEKYYHNCAVTQMDICINKNDAYWPQLVDYKQLYEEYPDAIFILNMRDNEDILRSMKKWNNYDERLLKYNPELVIDFDGSNDEKIKKLINKHFYDVKLFFQNKPEAKFLSYHIIHDDISKLNKYIDTKDLLFPEVNKNNKK